MKLARLAAALSLVVPSLTFAQGNDPRLEDARKKMAAGDPDGALAAVEVAVANHPDLPPAQLLFARLLFQNRQMAAGRAVMERAAVERPDHPEVYSSFGRLALAEGRLLDASLAFERATTLAASDRWPAPQQRIWLNSAHAGAAAVAERRKDWKNAYASLSVLAEFNPGDAITRYRLGRASFFLDKVEEADSLLRSAHKENPRLEPPDVTFGELWWQKGDADKAERYFNAALTKHPSDPRARHALTRFLIHLGRGEAARDSASKGLSLQPKDLEARMLLVLASRQAGDVPAAEAVLASWLADDSSNPIALSQAAQLAAQSKDPAKKAKALERANAAAMALQGRGEAQTTIGVVQFLLGNVAEAEKILRAAMVSGDAYADTAYYLALILEQKGDRDGAIRLFSRAIDAPGLFIHGNDAQARRDKLRAAVQTKP